MCHSRAIRVRAIFIKIQVIITDLPKQYESSLYVNEERVFYSYYFKTSVVDFFPTCFNRMYGNKSNEKRSHRYVPQ